MSQNRTFSQGGCDFSSVGVEGFGMMDMAPYNSALSSQSQSQGFRFSQETTERLDDGVIIPVLTQDYYQRYRDFKPSKEDLGDPVLARSLVMTQIKPFPGYTNGHYSEKMDCEEDQRIAQNLNTTAHTGFSQIFFEQMTPNPSPLSQSDAKFEFHGHEDSVGQQPEDADDRPVTPGKWYNGSAIQCDSSSSLMSIQSDVSMRSLRRSSTSSNSISSKSDAKKECNRMASKKLRERKNRERREIEARYEAELKEYDDLREEKHKALLELWKIYSFLETSIELRDGKEEGKKRKSSKSKA